MPPARSGSGLGRLWGAVVLGLFVLVLAQACGDSGRSTGPSGNGSVAVALRRSSGQLPSGCTGTLTADGPTKTSGPIGADGKASLGGLQPGLYVFTADIVCGGQPFSGQSDPVQIKVGDNNVVIQIFVAPSNVGAFCTPSSLDVGQSTQCTCSGSLVSGSTPAFSWSAPGASPGQSSGPKATFTFPSAGDFTLTCTVSNGPQTRTASVTVHVAAATATGDLVVTNSAPINSCCSTGPITFSGPGPVAPIANLPPGGSATRTGLTPGSYSAVWCAGPTPFTITAGQTTQLPLDGGNCG
jgi:PKD domain